MPLVGICAGGAGQPTSLPRQMEPVHLPEVFERSHPCAQWDFGRRLRPLAQRLPACRRPNPAGHASMTCTQLCTLSPPTPSFPARCPARSAAAFRKLPGFRNSPSILCLPTATLRGLWEQTAPFSSASLAIYSRRFPATLQPRRGRRSKANTMSLRVSQPAPHATPTEDSHSTHSSRKPGEVTLTELD